MNTVTQPKVIDKLVDFKDNADGLLITHSQHIPDDFISQLKRDKINADHDRSSEMYRVASIPVVIVEELQRLGFDVMREPVSATLKKLRDLGLDAFITTSKRI
jgi:hypothetical protein